MANKNTDPIEMLADSICNALVSASTRAGKETAPNDKTFPTIILGTNQKFTDDVSEEDKAAIIDKFSIPEAVEEGEQTYYTFKINGAYYCKQQNGDFKLYDNIMVYIPNGDWANMYFDYADGVSHNSGGGGSDTELPDYIVSPDMPGGDDCNIGDLWIVTNDETITEFTNLTEDTFVNMYEYKADENEVVDWRLVKVCIAETSSKVDVINDDYWIKTDGNNVFTEIDMWETSGSTTSFYEIYPNPERETAPNVSIYNYTPLKLGDYWYEIDSDVNKNLEARWIYYFNPETNRNEYKNEYNIQGGGGGVGEKVPESPNQTAERFNDYRAYTIDGQNSTGGNFATGSHDHVEGYENHGVGGYYNHYQGSYNYGEGGYNNDVGGTSNKSIGCTDTTVRGVGNTVTNCYYTLVSGNNARVTNLYNSLVAGAGSIQCSSNGLSHYNLFIGSSGFTAVGNLYGDVAIGDNLKVTSAANTAMFGQDNTATGIECGLLAGYECTATAGLGVEKGVVVLGNKGAINPGSPYQFALGCAQLNGNGFAVDIAGNVYATGSYGTMGADYAETYEWIDGNPDNEDRRGIIVTLEGKYIRPASSNDDYILGVVSSDPSVCGDTYDLYWHGKYKTDIYGKPLLDDDGKYIISDEYDPEQVYIPQSQRPEKDYVGTNGKLVVIDDGTCIVNKYCKPSTNGIGTYSDDKSDFRVIERLDETHVKVVIK